MRFLLALHSDDGVKYGVTVPDLKGCFSAGDSIDEAIEAAIEAIDAHVELMAGMGQDLPHTSSMKNLLEKDEFSDVDEWVHVDVPVERYFGPAEKINITVPALTLRRIDKYVQSIGETRSGFLVRAAEKEMEQAPQR